MTVKDVIVQKVKNNYGYEMANSFRDIEEYETKGKIPTRIIFLDMDPNTKENN